MPTYDEAAAIISFSSIKDDSDAMLSTIARRAGKLRSRSRRGRRVFNYRWP
ncbi:MAG: hypothetical protein IPJ07_23485 [Acidobacteria bacterium]|nr:hypothetical protein [Acidobacteriota bacterium]